jgi:hypothetical protein
MGVVPPQVRPRSRVFDQHRPGAWLVCLPGVVLMICDPRVDRGAGWPRGTGQPNQARMLASWAALARSWPRRSACAQLDRVQPSGASGPGWIRG